MKAIDNRTLSEKIRDARAQYNRNVVISRTAIVAGVEEMKARRKK